MIAQDSFLSHELEADRGPLVPAVATRACARLSVLCHILEAVPWGSPARPQAVAAASSVWFRQSCDLWTTLILTPLSDHATTLPLEAANRFVSIIAYMGVFVTLQPVAWSLFDWAVVRPAGLLPPSRQLKPFNHWLDSLGTHVTRCTIFIQTYSTTLDPNPTVTGLAHDAVLNTVGSPI